MRKLLQTIALLLALLLLGTCFVGCSQNEKPIGTCGSYDILYEELRFLVMTYKDRLEATYGDGNPENGTIWDDPATAETYRKELEDVVWDTMRSNYATLVACEAYKLTKKDLESDVIRAAVDEQLSETIAQYQDRAAFEKDLASRHMTEHLFRFYLAIEELKYELYYVLTQDLMVVENSETEFLEWLKDGNCVYVQHIFIENDKGESIAENRALAEKVRTDLIDGTRTLAEYVSSAVNEDMTNVAPYYVVRDVYIDEIANATLALSGVGDVSEVVEVENGFYVFVQVEDSTELLISQLPALFNTYQWVMVTDIVNTYEDKVDIQLNDFGKSLDLLAIT